MTAIFDSYKPLRNFLRQCLLEGALIDVWQLAQHLANGSAPPNLPGMPPYTLKDQVLQWEIAVLAREVLLHAQRRGDKRINSLASIQKVIGPLRETRNEGSKLRLMWHPGSLFDEMLRLTHQQFPWQQGNLTSSLIRNLKIFGSPAVAAVLERTTGLTVRKFFFLGLALSGHLAKQFGINSDQDYAHFGISRGEAQGFFSRLSTTVDDFRRKLAEQQIDENWDYSWNPLEATPLIVLDPAYPNRLYCPVPGLLLRRFSGGLYYDLVNEPGFSNAFGDAFQNYVGDVLDVAFKRPQFTLFKEEPYHVGKRRHDGADWILSGPDGNLFIECKTKRMTQAARTLAGGDLLRDDFGKIADAIVQHYKNVLEALEGKSKWQPNGLPATVLIITYEDWYLLGPVGHDLLKIAVPERLSAKGLPLDLVERMPYALMSTREFERCAAAIAKAGVQAFFSGKREEPYRQWLWPEYQEEKFPEAGRINFNDAFRDSWQQHLPEASLPAETGPP